jgi:hypothetical protein
MRIKVCVLVTFLAGCAAAPDVLLFRQDNVSQGGGTNRNEYYVKDGAKGAPIYGATPDAMKKARTFCGEGKAPVRQYERLPTDNFIFRCIQTAYTAVAD